MSDPREGEHDEHADDSMRNLLSHVSPEVAAELMDEAAPDMTEAEKAAWLKRWGEAMSDDPSWLAAGAASGSEFDNQGNAETDQSVCPTTGYDCPGSSCGRC